jgi:hypothetical protein
MPEFRKLSPVEVNGLRGRKGVDLQPYEGFLRECAAGEWGEAQIGSDEKKSTVNRRLTVAARKMGLHLAYRRSDQTRVVFEIRT